MKKTILTIAIALATTIAVQAERTTSFERGNRFSDRFSEMNTSVRDNDSSDGSLRLDAPGTEKGTNNQTDAPVGEGILVLTILAGGYLARKRK